MGAQNGATTQFEYQRHDNTYIGRSRYRGWGLAIDARGAQQPADLAQLRQLRLYPAQNTKSSRNKTQRAKHYANKQKKKKKSLEIKHTRKRVSSRSSQTCENARLF